MSDTMEPSGSGAIVEVEFALSDDRYPLVALPQTEDCRLVMEKLLPREEGPHAQYYSVVGTDPDRALRRLEREDHVEARLLVRYGSGGLFELQIEDCCPVCYLAKRGAVPISVTGTADGGTIVVELFPEDDPGDVVSRFLDEYSADLVAKRRKDDGTPLVTERELRDSMVDRLTERQREVLFAAFEAGYYERPRQTTGAELADQLGITSTTFQQHIRAAERKLVSFLVDYRSE